MSQRAGRHSARGRSTGSVVLCLLLGLNSCGLDEVEIPDTFEGPSETGLSLRLTAQPDIVTADGFSTSVVQVSARDQSGRPATGRDVFFTIGDEDGRFADLGSLRASGSVGVGTGLVVRTNGQGVAQVVYEAPARTDATANQTVLVMARVVGDDANAAVYRSVRIELRSAEPRLFPQNPDNAAPSCDFAVQAPNGFRVNQSILFQSTSFDPDGTIVRYWWDFGNGTRGADHPDVAASYRFPDTYTVTHVVTDDDGGQAACAGTLTIVP
jgi:PKD repeat protein